MIASVDNNTAYVEGVKRIEAFMVKDKKRYRKTDGWGYFFIRDGLLGVRISSITLSVHLQEGALQPPQGDVHGRYPLVEHPELLGVLEVVV